MIEARIREFISRHPFGRAIFLLVDHLEVHRAPTAAGAMAFDAFLSLVPLVAFAGYLLHRLRQDYEIVIGPIVRSAPGPVRDLVDAEFLRLSESGAHVVAPISIAAFLWVSSAGMSSAMGVFETMFRSPERPWYVRRAVAMGAMIASFVALLIVLPVSIFLATALGGVVARVLAIVVPVFVLLGLLCGFFRIAIRGPRPRKRRLVPGAIATIVLWAISSALFSLYVSSLARYATLYGGLAAVAIFLFWLWLLALAILVGGEINAQLEGVRDDGKPGASPLPAALRDANQGPSSSREPLSAGLESKLR